MTQLKPCPFCGSSDLWIDGGEYLNSFAVICTHCGGRVSYFDTKTEAITAWNRRVCDE